MHAIFVQHGGDLAGFLNKSLFANKCSETLKHKQKQKKKKQRTVQACNT